MVLAIGGSGLTSGGAAMAGCSAAGSADDPPRLRHHSQPALIVAIPAPIAASGNHSGRVLAGSAGSAAAGDAVLIGGGASLVGMLVGSGSAGKGAGIDGRGAGVGAGVGAGAERAAAGGGWGCWRGVAGPAAGAGPGVWRGAGVGAGVGAGSGSGRGNGRWAGPGGTISPSGGPCTPGGAVGGAAVGTLVSCPATPVGAMADSRAILLKRVQRDIMTGRSNGPDGLTVRNAAQQRGLWRGLEFGMGFGVTWASPVAKAQPWSTPLHAATRPARRQNSSVSRASSR